MKIEKLIEKMKEETKIFSYWTIMNEKQRLNFTFYHVYMNRAIMDDRDTWSRRNALRCLKNYKNAMS